MELHQMFDLGTEKKHAELMKKYLPNYHINLVDVRRLKNLESFQSDLQIIFGMLQCSQDKYALRTYVANHKDYFQKLDLETYHALGAFLNSRQLMEINVEKEEKEELDMCKALEDIYEIVPVSSGEMALEFLHDMNLAAKASGHHGHMNLLAHG